MPLPAHVAANDEPLPQLRDRPSRGPDLQRVISPSSMIGLLADYADDDEQYVTAWRYLMELAGLQVLGMYERGGEFTLSVGGPCDEQMRHRNRYSHVLIADLDQVPSRRDALVAMIKREGFYADARPRDPRRVTSAIRGFLINGGRILINPNGRLQEGSEVPSALIGEDGIARAACILATRAYYDCRRKWRSDAQIERAVRMLGKTTANGWITLEART